jgi:peptidyl-prolyl cis-trans isomerase D
MRGSIIAMLDTIRRAQPAIIKAVLGAVVVAFVATIFLEWGWQRPGRLDTHLATVGGESVSLREYQAAYNNLMEFYRRLYQDRFTEDMARSFNLKQQALDTLIQRKILLHEAKRQGLMVSDEELIERVQSYPAFQINNRFDRNRYIQILRLNRLTPEDFEQSQREELLIAKLENLIKDSVLVTESEIKEAFHRDKEQVNASYVRIDPAQFTDQVRIDEEDLAAYYREHPERFRQPEQVRVAYTVLAPEAFLPQVHIAEEQLAREYEVRKEAFRQEEQVRARHILRKLPQNAGPDEEMKVRAEAEAIQRRLQAGEDFAQLARELSEDPASAAEGGDLGFFKRGEMVKPFEDAAFTLRPGEVSHLVRTDFGYHLIKVEEKREAGYRPLAEVREPLSEQLRRDEARRLAETRARSVYEALVAPGAQWDAVLRQFDLTSWETPLIARGQAVEGIDDPLAFAEIAFALHLGEISRPTAIGERSVIVKLLERKDPHVPPLEEVKETVRQTLVQERSRELARQRAEEGLAQVRGGMTLEALAASLHTSVQQTGGFSRHSAIPQLGHPTAFIREAFRMRVGEARVVDLQGQPTVVVLTERTEFDAAAYEQEKSQVKERLLRQKQDQLFAQWLTDVRRQMEDRREVVVNQRLLAAL